jgi:ribosomal silencing factor RsfS
LENVNESKQVAQKQERELWRELERELEQEREREREREQELEHLEWVLNDGKERVVFLR